MKDQTRLRRSGCLAGAGLPGCRGGDGVSSGKGGHRLVLDHRPRRAGLSFVRHEAHQVLASSIGHIEDDHAPRLVGPDAGEVGLLIRNPAGLRTPARKDADALPVVAPAGGGLVDAAVPSDLVAAPVFDDAGLLVKDAVRGDRPGIGIARHGDFHVEKAAGDHPGQQFQGLGRGPSPAGRGGDSSDAVRPGHAAALPLRSPRSPAPPECSRRQAACGPRFGPAPRCLAPPASAPRR